MVQIGQMYCVPGSVVRSGHDKAGPYAAGRDTTFSAQLMYIGALLLAVGLVWLGLHLPKRPLSTTVAGTAPGLWRLRLCAFLATVAFFFTLEGYI